MCYRDFSQAVPLFFSLLSVRTSLIAFGFMYPSFSSSLQRAKKELGDRHPSYRDQDTLTCSNSARCHGQEGNVEEISGERRRQEEDRRDLRAEERTCEELFPSAFGYIFQTNHNLDAMFSSSRVLCNSQRCMFF